MKHRSPGIAAAIVRASFEPADHFGDERGAELEALISAMCEDEDAEWVFEEDRKSTRLRAVRDQLDKLILSFEQRRIIPPLRSVGASTTYYRFTVVAAPGEDYETVGRRARYRLHHLMIDALRALEPGAFERLCGEILREVGCTTTYVTR